MGLDALLGSLNPRQREAATLPNKHALVLAGAGTGKTKTIVARAAYLIAQGTPAPSIRILTFTRKSASEIVERVKLALGERAKGLGASTFHAWAMGLIHASPQAFGAKGWSIIDRDDSIQLFKMLRGKRQRGAFPTTRTLCDLYSFARNTGRTLQETLEFKEPDFLDAAKEIGEIMLGYEEKKRTSRYLDFDDILDVVAQQLNTSAEVREWVARQYDAILVDETQDTNPLQWRMLHPLKEDVTLFAVGDDAQSIYGFRGASFKEIHDFTEKIPGATKLLLQDNYRSTQEILNLSNWLLQQSPLVYDKDLSAVRGAGIKPALQTFPNEWEEGGWIAQDILRRKNLGAEWRHHQILVRSSFSGRVVESALLTAEIPYQFIGGQKILESAHVKDLLSLLRLVANPLDEIAWMRFLCLWPKVGEVRATKFIDKFFEEPNIDKAPQLLSKEAGLPEAANALEVVAQLQNEVSKAVRSAVRKMENILANKYRNQEWDKRRKDFPLVARLAEKHSSILAFIEEYLLDPLHGSQIGSTDNEDKVTLITIHSAKGTECETCYVVNVSPGAFPSTYADDDDEVEEERRVLYVALTRAKDELIMTRKGFSTWGEKRNEEGAIESYFLNNLPDHLVEETVHAPPKWKERCSAPTAAPVKVGIKL